MGVIYPLTAEVPPMAKVSDDLLQQMVNTIVEEVDPDQIILFGSQARGDTHEHSDVDLVVLEQGPFGSQSRHRKEVRLHRALARFLIPTDVMVRTHEDVEYWQDSINNVLARALREGRVLYERH